MAATKPVAEHRKQKARTTKNRPPHVREDTQIIERRAQALSLRKAGAHYRLIAERCGVSVETAYADVQAELGALRRATEEDAEAIREIELKRLDDYTVALTPAARRGDVRAIDTLLRVQDRRSRYLGLDAPTKSLVAVELPPVLVVDELLDVGGH